MHPLLLPLAGIALGAAALGVAIRPLPSHAERDHALELARLQDEITDLRHQMHVQHHPAGAEAEPLPGPRDRREGLPGGRPPGADSLQTILMEEAGLDAAQAARVARLMTTEHNRLRAAQETLHAEFTMSLTKVLDPGEVSQVLAVLDRHHTSRPEDGLPSPERGATLRSDHRVPPPPPAP